MAKKPPKTYDITEYHSDLVNSGVFASEDDILKHMERQLDQLKSLNKEFGQLKHNIQGTYTELDRLSNKDYFSFSNRTQSWRDDLGKMEKDYKLFQKEFLEEVAHFNAKWGKATLADIEKNRVEYMRDNNALLKLQQQNLEKTREMSAKAMNYFRDGINVFDTFSARVSDRFRGMTKGINEIQEGFRKSLNAVEKWTKPWAEANQASADFAKHVGLGANGMSNLLAETIRFGKEAKIGANYNKSLKEMLKLQQDYVDAVGRNISLTNEQKKAIAATSAVIGDQKTVKLNAGLENFGIDPVGASKTLGKMFSEASKKGIAMSKYSDNFIDNLKMAQNYTFENGVKGVASMAEKATKLKLEMQTVANFADKVNTVEGAITTGAQLQVLGGPFAQFADPLGMLYEGNADTEGLFDRMVNMFGDLGRFDKIKGQVDISEFNKRRIREAAKAIGANPNDMFEMIHAKGRRNEIANQMRGLGYSSKLEELIKNTATLDENGNAGVSLNGEFVGVDKLAGREEELIALNQSETEDIKEIAKMLRGWDDIMQGFKKQKDITQASWVQASGIGNLAMTAVGFLGQSNMMLGTIVGLLTAGAATAFGMGAYGMVKGTTRFGAGAMYRPRYNHWAKGQGLYGKDLKVTQRYQSRNGGVLYSPDGTLNRANISKLTRQGAAAKGAAIGIGNSSPYAYTRGSTYGFVPRGAAGVPSISPMMMGMGGYGGMNPMMMGMGGYGYESMGGPSSLSPINGGANSMLMGRAGHMYSADGMYLGRQLKNGTFKPGSGLVEGTAGRMYTKDGAFVGQRLKDGSFKPSKAFGGGGSPAVGAASKMSGLKSFASSPVTGMLGSMALSAGLGIASSAVDSKRQELISNGRIEEGSNEDWNRQTASKALGWAGMGASMGAMIGSIIPGVGTLIGAGIGAALGGIAGVVKGSSDKQKYFQRKALMERIAQFRNGQQLQGDYDNKTLARIVKYLETNDSTQIKLEDLEQLKRNGNDYNLIVRAKRYDKGTPNTNRDLKGIVSGPSHSEGGLDVHSKNGGIYNIQGGEAVVPKHVVDSLNQQDSRFMDNLVDGRITISPKAINPNSMMVAPSINSPSINGPSISEIKLSPLDININGNIKLDGGKRGKLDITDLILKDDTFISTLSVLINNEINSKLNSRTNKENNFFKFA